MGARKRKAASSEVAGKSTITFKTKLVLSGEPATKKNKVEVANTSLSRTTTRSLRARKPLNRQNEDEASTKSKMEAEDEEKESIKGNVSSSSRTKSTNIESSLPKGKDDCSPPELREISDEDQVAALFAQERTQTSQNICNVQEQLSSCQNNSGGHEKVTSPSASSQNISRVPQKLTSPLSSRKVIIRGHEKTTASMPLRQNITIGQGKVTGPFISIKKVSISQKQLTTSLPTIPKISSGHEKLTASLPPSSNQLRRPMPSLIDVKPKTEENRVFMDLLSELKKEKEISRINRTKKLYTQIPRLLPIAKPKHRTFSAWLKDCNQKASGCVLGMSIDTANEKPEDMDMDTWILIQQFQNSLESSLFDYNSSTITSGMNKERLGMKVLVDLGHKMVRTSRYFVCQGCNYAADTLSRLLLHLQRQEKSLLVYKCLRCHYRDVSKCGMKIHVNSHNLDPKYMMMPVQPDIGLYCAKCRFNLRYKSFAPHNEIFHNRVFQTNFNSDFIEDWREWFMGK